MFNSNMDFCHQPSMVLVPPLAFPWYWYYLPPCGSELPQRKSPILFKGLPLGLLPPELCPWPLWALPDLSKDNVDCDPDTISFSRILWPPFGICQYPFQSRR